MAEAGKGQNTTDRFAVEADGVRPLGRMRTVSHLTEEQKRDNEAHDKAVREALEEMRGD